MADRKDFSSWLEGTPQGNTSTREERARVLGIPATGPGSHASMIRRIGALIVDWGAASAISWLFFGYAPMATLAVFAGAHFLFVSTLGFTIGHWLFGLRVRPEGTDMRFIGFVSGILRTVLLCLVIPAAVWDAQGRGLHDKAARTIIVRR